MRIRAKTMGELNMHGPGVHWIHKDGDERDFSDDVGKKILTNNNYEAASTRHVAPVKEKEITTEAVVKKTELGRKDKKNLEATK